MKTSVGWIPHFKVNSRISNEKLVDRYALKKFRNPFVEVDMDFSFFYKYPYKIYFLFQFVTLGCQESIWPKMSHSETTLHGCAIKQEDLHM
jgi:hypothetical protein